MLVQQELAINTNNNIELIKNEKAKLFIKSFNSCGDSKLQ